jgi:hypothetical protein
MARRAVITRERRHAASRSAPLRLACLLLASELVLWLAGPAPAFAADDRTVCAVPESLDYSAIELPAMSAALKAQDEVRIVVVGSASSGGLGLTPHERAYPERLVHELEKRFAGSRFAVTNLSSRGQFAKAMADRFAKEVLPLHPALVIWQTGTVEAVRGSDLDDFGDTLDYGLGLLRSHDIDVILVNMQYSPQMSSLVNVSPYRDAMSWVSQNRSIMLFDRYEIMRYWQDSGTVDFGSPSKEDQARYDDLVHGCVAQLLGEMIQNGVSLSRQNADKPD